MRLVAVLAALAGALAPAGASTSAPCVVTGLATPGPRPLRFGITTAGQVFTSQPAPPDDPARTLAALQALRSDAPFVARLNRFFYRNGAAGIDRFAADAARFTSAGFEVSLQLRYGPFGPGGGSPAGFAAWVREVVAGLGRDPGVTSVEVTNEPNLTTAPDNSDGAHPGVLDALVEGVLAARDEADARGFAHVKVGFNWFHQTGPHAEDAFWRALASRGGPAFAGALDWVGLNVYPATYGTPRSLPVLEGQEMVKGLQSLRSCYLPLVGVGSTTPIRVMENGYPNGLGRTREQQAETLERMVRAVHEHAGTFNVTDYVWFDLRDTLTGALPYERNYGLLEDDYEPKPAFGAYRGLVSELG